MATRKKPVTTPLHLLQQLSHSLLEHLEQACSEALVDAEKLLAKLEKQRGRAQDKLHKAGARLEAAAAAGKAKAQAKARDSIAELEELLDTLKQRQAETRDYILRLKADAEQSLNLAQGIGKVKETVGQLLARREAGSAEPSKAPRRSRSAVPPAAPKAASAPARTRRAPSAKSVAPAAPIPAATKPAAKRTPAVTPVAAKPAAKRAPDATPAAAKPAAKRTPAAVPAAAKPAAKPAKPAAPRAPRKTAAKPAASAPAAPAAAAASEPPAQG